MKPSIIMGICPKCKTNMLCQFGGGTDPSNIINIDEILDIETAAQIDNFIVDCAYCGSEFILDAGFPIGKIKLKVKRTE